MHFDTWHTAVFNILSFVIEVDFITNNLAMQLARGIADVPCGLFPVDFRS